MSNVWQLTMEVMSDRNNTPLPDIAPGESFSSAPKFIADRYKVLGKLGQGGMGRVYECQDAVLARMVAVKLINRNLEEQYFARFHQEAKAASQLKHPNILHVLDFGLTDDRQPYMVMELVAGDTIDEILRRIGSFPEFEAIEIVTKVCLGMQHAHSQGVVHRDLKTSNIMLAKREQATIPLILDFGIAKMVNSSNDKGMLTKTGEIMGSPRYMSPEQAAGRIVDGRSDIYSLGCVLFEMLAGRPPFDAETAMETIYMHLRDEPPKLMDRSSKQFPDHLEAIIAKLLQKDPDSRFPSMQALHDELCQTQSLLEDSPPVTIGSAHPPPPKSNSATIILTSITAAITLIAGAAVLLYIFEPNPLPEKGTLQISNLILEATPTKHFEISKANFLNKSGARNFDGHSITTMTELRKAIAGRHQTDTLHLSEGSFDKDMMDYLLNQKEIDHLSFSDVSVTQEAQKELFSAPHIKTLKWQGPLVRASLQNLDKMSTLTDMQIAKAELTDEDINMVTRAEHLRELEIDLNKHLSGAALVSLKRIKRLNALNVSATDLTNDKLVQLADITSLTRLDISNNAAIDSDGVLRFWRNRKKKTAMLLYAVSCRKLPDEVQQQIHAMIPDLDLHSTHKSEQSIGEKALGGMLDYDNKFGDEQKGSAN